ncbi:MAG: nickel pincer cofactor biosynthesis protein LarC [Gemmataceae bacterium]
MRVLHFDCFSGISGDMTLASLIDAGVNPEAVRSHLDSLGLPIQLHVENVRKAGFAATHVRIEAPEEHKHRHLHHIEELLQGGKLNGRQVELALRIFRRLAEAEATVHGLSLEKVHFHEVGALDSIADIAGAAVALDLLGVEHVTCTPVPTGTGMVQCAHGLMPIPAPGTAELLKGVPLRPSSIEAEMTTPTGAAILTTIVVEWTETPAMKIEQIGYGAGTFDFPEQPNVLRVFVGEASPSHEFQNPETDSVWVIETNLDDVSAEVVGYCYDLLFAAGALDVFGTPITMKKNRSGVMLTVLTPESAVGAIENILFRETSTFGIRRHQAQRHKLNRESYVVQTSWGEVQGKLGWRDGEPAIFTPEYEDCARVAREHGVPLREVYFEVQQAYVRQEELITDDAEDDG